VCHTERLPQKPDGENLEAWARRRRYEAFARLLAHRNLDVVVTAHNANDVAETLLMRLIANKELNTIEEFDPGRRCLRPLTDITRDQIDEYVAKYGISYVEDPSNADTGFVRNRIRHVLLPLLTADFDPSCVWTLAEQARAVAEDCDALHEIAAEVARRIGPLEQGSCEWLNRFRSESERMPAGVRWRAVSEILSPLVGFSVGRNKAKAIEEALMMQTGSVALGGGLELVCSPKKGASIVPLPGS
jgi:tRNA(Ile)-lysidine synthase